MQTHATHGFQMSSSNTVPQSQPNTPADYGKIMTDQYGRTYVQTEHGRIY